MHAQSTGYGLQSILDARAAVERALQAETNARCGSAVDQGRAWAATRAAREQLLKVRSAERERFAESRGWRVYNGSQGWIWTAQLVAGSLNTDRRDLEDVHHVIDHRECFLGWREGASRTVQACRYPAAILSHTYGDFGPCVEYAQRYGLGVERLPYSWYYPGHCIAVLFTRGAL